MAELRLVKPSAAELPGYTAALQRGWSPDPVRLEKAAAEELARIVADPAGFLASLDDPEARGAPIKLPDGSTVPRLPGYRRWMWDGELVGSIGFRWQKGTSTLPAHVLGHIGYAVVPWKRKLGHAKRALALLLPEAKARGLDYVELTTDPDNVASQKVIQSCGGRLIERFNEGPAYGNAEGFRYRIDLR
ncbi:MAG: GNAT family N-acetyltransferase [Alphaproteobacteria bacterium]|nr:GNAT family N-acetyltransferase [Alphaproteobacteria bacterium]